ncbi:MAG TPA: TolC family protein [Anaeromyxobacteraceae bacterium]|nr:TolC family protein [Anaeromyxobacteraceae bacterium]
MTVLVLGAALAMMARGAAPVLTLADAERNAREHQPQLAQARFTADAASARADEARAPLLPQVSGTASYQRLTGNFAPRPGVLPSATTARTAASWATFDYFSFGLTASQLVYDFGQTSGRWRAAQASADAQRGSERATASQTLLTVRSAFFLAREQKALFEVARDTLKNLETHLAQVQAFVKMGTRPAVDLYQALADRANGRVQLINAENAYASSRAQLNQAMGVVGPTDYEVAGEVLPPVVGEDGGLEPLVSEAERNRPDLTALEQQARAQELTVGAAQGGYGPALGISTGFTDAGPPPLNATVWNWNATATLTWNIFQGGLTRATVSEARSNLSAARAQAEVLRQQIRVDVDQARLGVRAAQGSLGAADEVVVNARERLRLAERRYQEGVGTLVDLGDAQVALTTAAAQRAQADYNLSTSRAQLVRALGREVPRE